MTLAFTKHCKKQYGIDLFVAPPAKPRPEKSEKTSGFSIFLIQFLALQRVFFYSLMWGGPEAFFFVILDPFLDSFSDFFKPETLVFTVLLSFVEV